MQSFKNTKVFKLHKPFKWMKKGIVMVNKNILFNQEKFKQVLHFIIHKAATIDNVGKTVLYKMIYFSDLDFYELYNTSITGEAYFKLKYGPAPAHFEKTAKELEKKGLIKEIKSSYGGFPQKKFVSLCEPKIDKLNGEEIKIIERVVARLANMNAGQVSAYSHEDMPWKATEEGKEIDYELVFYRNQKHAVSQSNTGC
jgi:uncharacterized phage-associated protein